MFAHIDFSPVTGPIMELLGVIIMALVTELIRRLLNYIGVKKDSQLREYIGTAAKNGAALAIQKAKDYMQDRASLPPRTGESSPVEQTINYLLTNVPDNLKKFGLIDKDGKPTEAMYKFAEAQIAKIMIQPPVAIVDASTGAQK